MMKNHIIASMEAIGWKKEKIVDAFSKDVKTFFGESSASIWLSYDEENDRWWFNSGNFTSAGENVLATAYAFIPSNMPTTDATEVIKALAAEMDQRISQAFSVRLL